MLKAAWATQVVLAKPANLAVILYVETISEYFRIGMKRKPY